MAQIGPATKVTLHPLSIRESEDDPDTFVVGRRQGGVFAELPRIGVDAIRLLESGLTVGAVERRLSADGSDGSDGPDGEPPDIADLVTNLVDLGWVSNLDGAVIDDPVGTAPVQVAWLRQAYVGWIFSRPAMLCFGTLLLAAAVTVVRRPALLPSYADFFWTDFVGVATLVNTAMFAAGAVVHELMHVAAARSLGLPARIGLGTRLTNLALQTDVSAAWAAPRRHRYRIYLAGMAWDAAAIAATLLVLGYAHPPDLLRHLLSAYILVAAGGMVFQTQIYMRTDLYFVAMDALRCGDLFHDGLRYARYLVTRPATALRRRKPADNPIRNLPAKERRAVRIYAPLVVLGAATALTTFALYVLPIVATTVVRALSAIVAAGSGGGIARAIDGAVVLAVEFGLQGLFVVTFARTHPAWLRWGARRRRKGGEPHA